MNKVKQPGRGEAGLMLMETLVALALVGSTLVAFLSGLATAAKVSMVADEQSTAESLARTQMESAKSALFASGNTTYTPADIPSNNDYYGYSANIAAEALNANEQKVTVTVSRFGRQIMTLEGYKVNR